jgi:hypothetical protein
MLQKCFDLNQDLYVTLLSYRATDTNKDAAAELKFTYELMEATHADQSDYGHSYRGPMR